jgi:predicted adenylyl cyclase CyaB
MIETEIKLKLENDEFKKISKTQNLCFFHQKNTIYYLENGFLRIRKENNKEIFTYKGKRKNNKKYNSRVELEVEIKDKKNLKKILFWLGYKDSFYYEKQRASFELNNCVICVDKLSNGENYLEIEGSKKDIQKTLNYFGLQYSINEKRSYQEILDIK